MDLEARLHGAAPSEHPEALSLWLRLLTCTQLIEKQVRSHLRAQFDTALRRFDLMAQLERAPDGMKMKELSRSMMVTSGNITGITDQLVAEGLVERMDVEGDRRAYLVRLTPQGREQFNPQASYVAEHFAWSSTDGVGTVTLNRPDRKNPLTFQSYAELRDFFYALRFATDVKAIVVTGAGGNFCSGGDVHEIIGPLTTMTMPELLEFTRMTGDLVKAMRACPQPVLGAIDGICAGAGAMMAFTS